MTLILGSTHEARIGWDFLHILKIAMPVLGKTQHTKGSRSFITSSLQLVVFEKKRKTLHKGNDPLQNSEECYKAEFSYAIEVPEAIYLSWKFFGPKLPTFTIPKWLEQVRRSPILTYDNNNNERRSRAQRAQEWPQWERNPLPKQSNQLEEKTKT